MKKVLILAAICIVLSFSGCSERSESSISSSDMQPDTLNAARESTDRSTQPEALDAASESTDRSAQSVSSSTESVSEGLREHLIFCFGFYNEEINAVDVYCSSTESGVVSLYESGAGGAWTNIADLSENEPYSYKITEDFKEKKIKAVQETANGRLESAAFSIVFSDGKYVCEMPDSDNDLLSDFEEKIYGTDPDNPDTDGDGFSDHDEIAVLETDPLVKNEDGDLDGDGLSDKMELELGTDPRNADTDGDGLSDFDEINKYKTDPLNADTDGDTIKDGAEVAIGLDPNNTATFGVPDAEYKIKQTIDADSYSLKSINKKDSPYALSLEITASGM